MLVLLACLNPQTEPGNLSVQDSGAIVADADGDGYGPDADCDDSDASVHPGALELCDEVDNDCDDAVDEGLFGFVDQDGDGFGSGEEQCSEAGVAPLDGDCDDAEASVNPGAEEICDGLDNDCDGQVDQGLIGYLDEDEDGFGTGQEQCFDDAPVASVGGDCDDADPEVHPTTDEILDGLDNDCDGGVDELTPEDATTLWYEDTSEYCAGRMVTAVGETLVIGGFCNQLGWTSSPGRAWFVDATATGEQVLDDAVYLEGDHNEAVGVDSVALSDSQVALSAGLSNWPGQTQDPHIYVIDLPVTETGLASDVAVATITGHGGNDGLTVEQGYDVSGDGEGDLLATARGYPDWDGSAFLFHGPLSGDYDYADADLRVAGQNGSCEEIVGFHAGEEGILSSGYCYGSRYSPGEYKGVVRYFEGQRTGTVQTTDADLSIIGSESQVRIGAYAVLYDWNGDGTEEIVVGSYDDLYVFEAGLSGTVNEDAAAWVIVGVNTLQLEDGHLFLGDHDAGELLLYEVPQDEPQYLEGVFLPQEVAVFHQTEEPWYGHSVAVTEGMLWVGSPGNIDLMQPGRVYGYPWGF